MTVKHLPLRIEKASHNEYDARFILSAATLDRVNDTIDPKAYKKAVKEIDKLIALFNHNANQIVGYWRELKAVDDTLTGYIKFYHKDWGAMVKDMLEFGIPLGASIGFDSDDYRMNDAGTGLHFNDISLLETSIVAVPAHPRAIEIAKNYGVDLKSIEVDNTLKSALSGVNRDYRKEVIRQAKAVLNHSTPA